MPLSIAIRLSKFKKRVKVVGLVLGCYVGFRRGCRRDRNNIIVEKLVENKGNRALFVQSVSD